jgi:hypothetical protein
MSAFTHNFLPQSSASKRIAVGLCVLTSAEKPVTALFIERYPQQTLGSDWMNR